MKSLRAMLLGGVMLLWPEVAEAKTMALLVGVADYDTDSAPDLLGPRNDVSILWRALKGRGIKVEDIAVLSDGLPQGADFPVARDIPNSAAILAGLDRLAAEATSGDTVIFYYSGHGSDQPDDPAQPEDEPEYDGRDQVLLPSDVGDYDPIKLSMRNAITDDMLGSRLSAIRAKGAFVWAVIDACHSGTVTRGAQVARAIDPAKFGVPPAAATQAPRSTARDAMLKPKDTRGQGGLVGFFAVESDQLAIEQPFPGYSLPMVGEGDKQRMGIFTNLLHSALTRNTASTYRDLAQEIIADMNAGRFGSNVTPPVFDGDLEQPIPGSAGERLPGAVTGVISGETIAFQAGALHGFDVAAGLALYAPGAPGKPIGHAEVSEATAVTSKALITKWETGAAAIVSGTIAAVIEAPAISFSFIVAPPPASDFTDAAVKARTGEALALAFKDGAEQLGVTLADSENQDADIQLRVKDDRLWILKPNRAWVTTPGASGQTPSVDLADDSAALKNAVWALARAAKLIRVASALGEGSGDDDELTMSATISTIPGQDAKGACPDGKTRPAGAQSAPMEPLLAVAAGNCNYVDIAVQNDTTRDYFVSGFYVDALGGVTAFPPGIETRGCVRTLATGTGKALSFRFWIDTWDEKAGKPSSTGIENFVILAIPKDRDNNQPPRLCSLVQPTPDTMQKSKSAGNADMRSGKSRLAALLDGIGGESTRAVSAPADDGPQMTGRLFVFDVKP